MRSEERTKTERALEYALEILKRKRDDVQDPELETSINLKVGDFILFGTDPSLERKIEKALELRIPQSNMCAIEIWRLLTYAPVLHPERSYYRPTTYPFVPSVRQKTLDIIYEASREEINDKNSALWYEEISAGIEELSEDLSKHTGDEWEWATYVTKHLYYEAAYQVQELDPLVRNSAEIYHGEMYSHSYRYLRDVHERPEQTSLPCKEAFWEIHRVLDKRDHHITSSALDAYMKMLFLKGESNYDPSPPQWSREV